MFSPLKPATMKKSSSKSQFNELTQYVGKNITSPRRNKKAGEQSTKEAKANAEHQINSRAIQAKRSKEKQQKNVDQIQIVLAD